MRIQKIREEKRNEKVKRIKTRINKTKRIENRSKQQRINNEETIKIKSIQTIQ